MNSKEERQSVCGSKRVITRIFGTGDGDCVSPVSGCANYFSGCLMLRKLTAAQRVWQRQ